jgi:hypothetical protein
MTQEARSSNIRLRSLRVSKNEIVCHSDLMKVMVQVVKDGGENAWR